MSNANTAAESFRLVFDPTAPRTQRKGYTVTIEGADPALVAHLIKEAMEKLGIYAEEVEETR